MLGVRIDKLLDTRLSALAEKAKRTKSYLAKEALTRYVEEEEQKHYENELATARWQEYQETGEAVASDSVENWLESWGSEQEAPCPSK